MRRAASYPCPFCSHTSETRDQAKQHLATKHVKAITKLAAPKKVRPEVVTNVRRH